MKRLAILLRMLRNRFFSSDPVLRSDERPWLDRVVFVLNFFPPYTWLCSLWALFCGRCVPDSAWAGGVSRAMMRRGLLFGALRHLSPEDRTKFNVAIIRRAASRARPIGEVSDRARALALEIGRTGFTSLGPMFSRESAQAAVQFFRGQNGYRSQTPLQSDGILRPFGSSGDESNVRYFCFPLKTSLLCPQVRDVIGSPLLHEVAAAYLRFMPVLFAVNTFASLGGESDHYVMRMHRDFDDFMSVTFFVYWSDVSAENGATIYIPGSHLSSNIDLSQRAFLSGAAGEVFGIDTFGLHAGNKSVHGYRLATWFRFGGCPNLATIQDPGLVPEATPLLVA